MRTIRVTFDDGNTITTNINGTEDEIRAYYIGNWFNLGVVEDEMHQAVSLVFLDTR